MGGGEAGFFAGFFGLAFALAFVCGNTKPISSTSVGRPETNAGNMLAASQKRRRNFLANEELESGHASGLIAVELLTDADANHIRLRVRINPGREQRRAGQWASLTRKVFARQFTFGFEQLGNRRRLNAIRLPNIAEFGVGMGISRGNGKS